MPTPDHEGYRARTLAWLREHKHAPDVPAQLERHMKAAAPAMAGIASVSIGTGPVARPVRP